MNGNNAVDKRVRRALVARRTKKCPFCPWHDGENRGRRCRPDKHKTARKGR